MPLIQENHTWNLDIYVHKKIGSPVQLKRVDSKDIDVHEKSYKTWTISSAFGCASCILPVDGNHH